MGLHRTRALKRGGQRRGMGSELRGLQWARRFCWLAPEFELLAGQWGAAAGV